MSMELLAQKAKMDESNTLNMKKNNKIVSKKFQYKLFTSEVQPIHSIIIIMIIKETNLLPILSTSQVGIFSTFDHWQDQAFESHPNQSEI